MRFAKLASASAIACLSLLLLGACVSSPLFLSEGKMIYLVRHAEKEPGRDPALTPGGIERAQALAMYVADADLGAIYSTRFRRTRDTAGPVAQSTSLPIIYYDPSDLAGFATQLRASDGNALVVGHSNTTPELVTALGGEAGAPIVEATEYDRLYILRVQGEQVSTRLVRYGAPSPE